MNSKFNILSFISLSFCLLSCQRVIDVQVADAVQQLVIEGNVVNTNTAQVVTISRSVPYNSLNFYPLVSGASVSITDGNGNTFKLPESGVPGKYILNSFRGKPQALYILNVNVDGRTYTASSKMPALVNLDSLSVSGQLFGSTLVKSVAVNYLDPPGVANQYKYVMYVNGVMVKRIFAEDDRLTDGRYVTSILYEREIDLKRGDKVDVDMQCIDLPMYNYWNTLGSQGGNSPSDSATPANPPSNFNGSVLGYFSAHTTQRKSVIIP